jgi:hypothetical protein
MPNVASFCMIAKLWLSLDRRTRADLGREYELLNYVDLCSPWVAERVENPPPRPKLAPAQSQKGAVFRPGEAERLEMPLPIKQSLCLPWHVLILPRAYVIK